MSRPRGEGDPVKSIEGRLDRIRQLRQRQRQRTGEQQRTLDPHAAVVANVVKARGHPISGLVQLNLGL